APNVASSRSLGACSERDCPASLGSCFVCDIIPLDRAGNARGGSGSCGRILDRIFGRGHVKVAPPHTARRPRSHGKDARLISSIEGGDILRAMSTERGGGDRDDEPAR